jgi:hypothetical protein
MLGNIFLFLDFFKHFSEMLQQENVGFINYFFQHFAKCCKHFSKMLEKINIFRGGRTRAPVSGGRRAPDAGSPGR